MRRKPSNLARAALLAAVAALAPSLLGPSPARSAAGAATPQATAAQESIFVPLFTYRTGPFANSGTPIANGMHDYLTLLNERDGGIGGVKLAIEECETGYDNDKGVACYEAVRTRNPVLIVPWSTGIALKLIPRVAKDKLPLLTMAHGVSASARGTAFPLIFNPPVTYWDGLTQILTHIASEVGGMRKLKGLRVGYIYLDSGYGREVIPLFEQLAKDIGFDLKLYPVPANAMEAQAPLWKQVMSDQREYMVMYGWGAMNPSAVKTAAAAGFPMSRFFSIWWPTDSDMRAAGEAANGFKTLNWHNVGQNYPQIQDILKFVVANGKSRVGSPGEVGELAYNHGVYNSMLIAEAIRTAQAITGKKLVTGEDVRRGFESLDISAARLKEIGLDGFTEPIRLTCDDHNGHRPTYIQQWHGTQWLKISGQILPMRSRLEPLLEAAVRDYVAANAPWPARTEPCDATSLAGRAQAQKSNMQNAKE